MKKPGSLLAIICACTAALVLLAGLFPYTAFADSYTATTMRLLRFEGTVEIEDASGNPRAAMENARFNSGESMKTAEASSASVGLDKGRIVTLDEKSRVEFEKQNGAVSMNLTEGRIFLDVSEKLGAGETMDIKTATMVVGIRGTIVYVSSEPVTDENAVGLESADLKGLSPEKGRIISISQIGVLEGTAEITYLDDSNREQSVSVEAGQKATVPEYSEDAEGIPAPAVSEISDDDIKGFVLDQVTGDAAVIDRVRKACDVVDDIDLSGLAGIYTADGDWTWDSPVTLVAQSASKYYDGQPLTRSSDILVSGLPSIFSVKASAGGSRTDAGESDNPVADYSIYNKAGENVTRHFTNVKKVSGTLLVVPAPLTIHTETAEKVYDGTPLTEPNAYVTFYKGSGSREEPWRNTSYVVTESAGNVSYDNQTLYGICGVIWVNAANPLTGERREIQLKAGQKLTVFLSDLEGKQSIELKIENLTENDLPGELLRLYGDNPALLEQACKDTGWDVTLLQKRIEALPRTPSGTASIEQGGLVIRESESDRLMQNLTNVRITVDTEITDYNNRALGSEEAHYSSLSVDESIKVTASGSQKDVGTGINTYTIDWGTANRSNYEVGEDLGTLTVTPASVTVTTGSAEKEYDGSPLTNSEASISGLVNGETAAVTATGSITEVGSAENTYSIRWNSADRRNYSVSESLGTLRVTAPKSAVILTAASAEKTYDGTALTDSSVTAQGLPSGFTVRASVSGSRTDAGTSENTISSYTIYDAYGSDVTGRFSNITTKNGTLKITPKTVTVRTGSAQKEYDGSPLTNSEASISGLVNGETAAVTATGSITGVGSTENTYSINWGSASSGNYSVSEVLGTLRVTEYKGAVTLTAASAEKTYDGTALTDNSITAQGLPSGFTVSADVSGGRTDAGSAENTISSYTICNTGGSDVTGWFSNVTVKNGTLKVTPKTVTVRTGSAEKEYDGSPLTNSEASISGLVNGETASVTASGSITGVGSTENTYSISWGSASSGNYSVSEVLGTLRVTEYKGAVTLTAASAEKTYDATALTDSSFTAQGLPSGFTVSADVFGSRTDAGSAENTITSYTIYNADGDDVTGWFSNITAQNGILTVNPFPVEFDLCFFVEEGPEPEGDEEGGEEAVVFEYYGYPYFPEWILASYEGTDEPVEPVDWSMNEEGGGTYSFTFTLPWDAKLVLNGTGYSDAGSYAFEPEATFLEGKKDNYEITFINNAIKIKPAALTITASASKEYDGEPLSGSDAVMIEGLAERDSIVVTATGTITDAGTADNPYTVDWGDTNPDNYTVTEEPGILEVTPREVTITSGSKGKVYDGEALSDNSYELSPSDPWVNGQAPIITVTGSITNVGTEPNSFSVDWNGIDDKNYNVTENKGTLTVEPVDILLIAACEYKVSDDITITKSGLTVQVNNVDEARYYVDVIEDNSWRITFDWGDKIDLSTVLIKDETSYAIIPIHEFVSGESGNYTFNTKDQEGTFDIPPVYPGDDSGMGTSSTFGAIAGRSLPETSERSAKIAADEYDNHDDSSTVSYDENGKENSIAEDPDSIKTDEEDADRQGSEEERPVETASPGAASFESIREADQMTEESPAAVQEESPAAVQEESPTAVQEESPAAVQEESPAEIQEESPAEIQEESPAAAREESSEEEPQEEKEETPDPEETQEALPPSSDGFEETPEFE